MEHGPEEEVEEAALIECPHCGVTSTVPEVFKAVRTRRQRTDLLCPPCFEAWKEGAGRRSIKLALALVFLAWLLWSKGNGSVALVIGGLSLGLLFTILLMPLHELAHAVTAIALGMRVYWIVIGSYGKPLYQFRLRGCLIQVNRMPFGGHTTVHGPATRFPRLRQFLVVLAGPLLHAGLFLAALWLIDRIEQSSIQAVWVSWAAMVFAAANLFELVLNLWPARSSHSVGELCNDGLLLLKIPFESEDAVRVYPFFFYLHEPMARVHRRDFAGAIECLDEGLRCFPGSEAIRAGYAGVFEAQGDFDAAASVLEEVRRLPAVTPQLDAMLRNDIAWCDVASGRPNRLERALEYSQVAMEAMPWEAAFRGTRGSALLLAGDIGKGMELLLEAWRENVPAEPRASNAAMLAIGSVRQGRHEEARNWLRRAEKLNPHCLLLDRARRELAEAAG